MKPALQLKSRRECTLIAGVRQYYLFQYKFFQVVRPSPFVFKGHAMHTFFIIICPAALLPAASLRRSVHLPVLYSAFIEDPDFCPGDVHINEFIAMSADGFCENAGDRTSK
ncbi:MAG: hypothetical protein WDN26_01610 [Chitinophagaceae bacterium]